MWSLALVQTITGAVGRRVEPTGLSWAIDLNGIDSLSFTLKKDDIKDIDRKWISPWWASAVLIWVDEETENEYAICGGPITGWPSESKFELSFDASGIRKIFEMRNITPQDETGKYITVKKSGMGLGTLAQEMVSYGMAKPGGRLPIVFGTPRETGKRLHERTFEWWNLANSDVDKRLSEISEVIDGPDIMFFPEFKDSHKNQIQWRMVNGTENNPCLHQTSIPDWDYTSYDPGMLDVSVTSNGQNIVSMVWATGAGEGAKTTIVGEFSDRLVNKEYPFLETVISDPDQAKHDPLIVKAQAELRSNQKMIDQLSATVRADSDKNPLWTWKVGHQAQLTIKDLWSIPDGTRMMRIIKASGDLSANVKLEFQEDQWTNTEI